MSEKKAQQKPIVSKTYDLIVWLIESTRHFPNRHDFTKRLLDAVFITLPPTEERL